MTGKSVARRQRIFQEEIGPAGSAYVIVMPDESLSYSVMCMQCFESTAIEGRNSYRFALRSFIDHLSNHQRLSHPKAGSLVPPGRTACR